MILATNVLFVLAALVSGAIKKWKTYYETILFISFCDLLYNLLCKNHLTWAFYPDFLLNHKTTELVNLFVLLPATTMLYLHFFPNHKTKQFVYYLGWIAGYSVIEFVWFRFGRITYHHGWNFYWSIGFYFAMFYVLRTHHTNLKRALLFSLVAVVLLIITFKIPIWT
ncbi:CBO0543 family protein [Paenibacillus allorhizosphaerae]|uniref:Uncharacterized protein n=1 Tax=Paenibacillus allorhizosphaerae TaxID=2849866 RepID=A0ABM8VDX5_9BACL|nr:hypothetical protein PAECIP111802_01547 [Paenibacillus allorhizosphaerae]